MVEPAEFAVAVLGNLVGLLSVTCCAQQKLSQFLCSVLVELGDLRLMASGGHLHNYFSQYKTCYLRRPVTEKSLSDCTPAASLLIRIHFQPGTQSLIYRIMLHCLGYMTL